MVGKRRFLQNGQVFHHAVVDDVLHDLIYEIDLSAIEAGIVQVLRKSLLCRIHIKPDDLPHKFTQRLLAILGLVILFCTDLVPECFLQRLHILRSQRNITL